MQFVLHELLDVTDDAAHAAAHAEVDADTINAVLEEGGKFAAEVLFPLNLSGDAEGCTLDKTTHEVRAPKGFKEAYAQYVEGGWPALSCDPAYGGQGLPHRAEPVLLRDAELGQPGLDDVPGPVARRLRVPARRTAPRSRRRCTCPS
jgi:alkylation response protein AidB-like acyl-CoA dehydrogenase